ncbi:hypothetical protein [Candidatus Tisiphia endosymbiont of Empis tessellata]|uniref:hypothetical protein n=1 Tax=Candidatus Tisiphia endosymbiont of Empis tessellata TaxID=3066259 RepID=UPI00313D3BF7
MKATLYILSSFGLGAMKASIVKSLNSSIPISLVVFSLILSVVIWREIPGSFSIIGAIIIISSGVYISRRQKS